MVDLLGNLINASSSVGASPPTQAYQYDPLYRLTNVQNGSGTSLESFTYDLTGDRLSKTLSGTTSPYTYTAGTHRLASVASQTRGYDADGNENSGPVTFNGTPLYPATFTYDNRNRLTQVTASGAIVTFNLNGRGERVFKNGPNGGKLFSYDEGGRLLGEYTTTGALGAQYVYVDSMPVAYITGGVLYYIETDQLGTPRQVILPGATTANDAAVWKWGYFASNSAFGENAPSVQTITFNLRFPGQYFDAETGLNYNYFRDYEPGTGRYVESDPIGLRGGISTYGYVGDKPLRSIDPRGLSSVDDFVNCMARNATREMPLNCYDTLFAEAQGSIEIFRAGCSAVNHGLECFTTCYIKAFFGPDLTEAAENGAKAAVAKALEEMAKTTMEKRLKDLVPVILAADTANDVYGTIKCTTTCIKN